MDMDDAVLMFQGWGEELMYQQQLLRKSTIIIADVTNRSFGGKGVKMKNVWPLPGDNDSTLKNMDKKMKMLQKFRELDLAKGIKHGRGNT